MEWVAGRNETWKSTAMGTAIGIGACALTLGLGARLQAITGDAGVLLGLFVATAVAAWFAGRWVGMFTTLVGAFAAAYMLPPSYSLAISKPADFAALYTFAVGGVIVSLLCGAAWQLRLEARDIEATHVELARLRRSNAELQERLRRQDAALLASDQFFAEAALAAQPPATPDEAPAALKNWSRQPGIRRMLEILLCRATHEDTLRSVHLNADRLPDSWLVTAAFRPDTAALCTDQAAPVAPPLTPLEIRVCNRIVARRGGRCWTSRSGSGTWELKFTLPRT
jgi:hypothetical protein